LGKKKRKVQNWTHFASLLKRVGVDDKAQKLEDRGIIVKKTTTNNYLLRPTWVVIRAKGGDVGRDQLNVDSGLLGLDLQLVRDLGGIECSQDERKTLVNGQSTT